MQTMTSTIAFRLDDHRWWNITAGDDGAQDVISNLTRVMRLEPALPASNRPLLRVWSRQHLLEEQASSSPGVTVHDVFLEHRSGETASVIALMQVSTHLCRQIEASGGVLIHGALADWQGHGVLLAGPSGVGKTTTSCRLPSPWRSCSDDATLIVPDHENGFRAHPWPTWSRLLEGDRESSWEVERALPLSVICLLGRGDEDSLHKMGQGEAVARLMCLVEQVSWPVTRDQPAEVRQAIRLHRLEVLCHLVRAVPAYGLRVTLTGEFWKILEQVLENRSSIAAQAVICRRL